MFPDLALSKQRLPLPELLVRLGLFECAPGAGSHPCPLHQERKGAAFNLRYTRGVWLWICHGKCATGGDEVSFLEAFHGLNRRDAIAKYRELTGFSDRGHTALHGLARPPRYPKPKQTMLDFPPQLHPGGHSECEQVARLRSVPTATTVAMSKSGLLGFADVCGLPSWIVFDAYRKIAEARRLDGAPYPPTKILATRKTHTLKGSQKNWPLGLAPGDEPILLVEGSGDFVAAHYFCAFTQRSTARWKPVAMLGASVNTLHPEAVPLLTGRRVRIVPQTDEAGAKAGRHWAKLLQDIGCTVDGFDLSRLSKADGSPVCDLNDCTTLIPEHEPELKQLFL